MSLSSPDKATRATSSTDQPQHANSAKGPEINLTAMHGFKLYAIFIGICFGTFLMSLDIFVLATVLASSAALFDELREKIKSTIEATLEKESTLPSISALPATASLLGIFTGQRAQW